MQYPANYSANYSVEVLPPLMAGIGEILWDIISPTEKYLGGATANFAYHCAQLGARGVAVSCVGSDAPGREIEAQLGQSGLTTDYLRRDAGHPTGTVTVTRAADGQPHYVIHENVAWDCIPFDALLRELAGQADAVCFGSLGQRAPVSRNSIQAFVRATRRDCLRVFDINLRQSFYDRPSIEISCGLADVLKLNHEELPVLAGLLEISGDENSVVAALMTRFALRLVALTRGKAGSVLYTKFRRSEHAGYPTTIVDTVGAGDAFTAMLTWELLRAADLDRLHDGASRLASYVCSQPGGTPLLPPELRQELLRTTFPQA